jgi:hypothetical protein
MSLAWLAAAILLPLLIAFIVAWPFWVKRAGDEIGAITGALVVFSCVVLFIGREYVDYEQKRAGCAARQIACRFQPGLFPRLAIYGGIGMAQVMLLFVAGLSVEERLRRRRRQTSTTHTS